ncbi:upstream activation factor subunit spp27-like [Senna tora]|uniref:Upstream activation factor subunit spp27-like n=1 Tax=Senna tora TaxID=362788 RepID=A0A834W5Y4_9FABA|nr:upstream activation factor subunit spp27-like [Senna tora]
MAIMCSGLFSTFLTGDTASSFAAAPPSRFSNLRMVRSVTYATVSEPASATGKKPRGIMKPRRISPEMQALVGLPEISRTQALKHIWAYIKDNNLQDPENKKIIICDEKLKKIFAGKDQIGFLEIAGLISPHFL